jgi:uncharacterized protein
LHLKAPTRKIEQMNDDLMARLRRLGLVKGTRNLKPVERRPSLPSIDSSTSREDSSPGSLELLFPGGYFIESSVGTCFVVDHVYPIHYSHGVDRLSALLELSPAHGSRYTRDNRLEGKGFRDFVFLDTETTGLAGASTLAFMVGVAFFESSVSSGKDPAGSAEAFVVRQYFLRDHADEAAMLLQLEELLSRKAGLITFNGRTFDIPLLDYRFIVNRLSGEFAALPNIDLLPPSRRLWRARLGSCALGALEEKLLGLQRTQEDVPGWLIPSLYFNYLRTGDAHELRRVFYHNQIDMLSMVSLATRIFRYFRQADEGDALDLLSLGRWQADLGLHEEAETTLRRAIDADLPLEAYQLALHRLATLFKKTGRRDEAVIVWQQLAVTSTGDVSAHIELAKHYEWQVGDIKLAQYWTGEALSLVDRLPPSPGTSYTRESLLHRRDRLQNKPVRLSRSHDRPGD